MKLHLPSNNFSWNGIHCRRNVMILTICLNYRSGIRWVHCSTSTRTLFLPWWFCTPGNAASSPVVSIYGHSSVPVAPPPQTTQVVAVFVQFFPGPSLAFSTSDNYADHHLVCAIYPCDPCSFMLPFLFYNYFPLFLSLSEDSKRYNRSRRFSVSLTNNMNRGKPYSVFRL